MGLVWRLRQRRWSPDRDLPGILSWGGHPPKRWEEDRKALIHWGMPTMRSRNRRLCGYSRCLGQTGSRFWEDLFCTGRAPSSLPFRGSCPESTWGQSRMQNYHKRPENIGDNARGQGAMAWVDPTGYPTETQQKRTCLRIPAQSRFWYWVELCPRGLSIAPPLRRRPTTMRLARILTST